LAARGAVVDAFRKIRIGGVPVFAGATRASLGAATFI